LGPFASAPGDFAGLRHTAITASQSGYLVEREHLLSDPRAHDAFASISAFASLHVGFTCTVLFVALYFRWRLVSVVLAIYLAAVMVATVYFGWHFLVDDIAGVVLAAMAVGLSLLMVRWSGRSPVTS
jgi:membrane-associated phospholipid phosphatase